MEIQFDFQKLENEFVDLYHIMGIHFGVLDQKGNWRISSISKKTARGKEGDFCCLLKQYPKMAKRCQECDKRLLDRARKSQELAWHICHAGLFDALFPLVIQGTVVGYVSFGQIRTDHSEYNMETNDKELRKAYEDLIYLSEEQLQSLRRIVPKLVTLSNIQVDDKKNVFEQVIAYIDENLQEDLNLTTLCKTFHVSKNFLYKVFREIYDDSVNNYITTRRIQKARYLLRETADPIYVIAQTVGINSCTYFSKLFKNETGMSPYQYRKKTV